MRLRTLTKPILQKDKFASVVVLITSGHQGSQSLTAEALAYNKTRSTMKTMYLIKYATALKGIKYYDLWNIDKKMWVIKDGAAVLFTTVLEAHDYAIKNGLK